MHVIKQEKIKASNYKTNISLNNYLNLKKNY